MFLYCFFFYYKDFKNQSVLENKCVHNNVILQQLVLLLVGLGMVELTLTVIPLVPITGTQWALELTSTVTRDIGSRVLAMQLVRSKELSSIGKTRVGVFQAAYIRNIINSIINGYNDNRYSEYHQ